LSVTPGPDEDIHGELSRRTSAGEHVVLATAVRTEGDPPCGVGQKLLLDRRGPIAGSLGCSEFDAAATRDVARALDQGTPITRTYPHHDGMVDVLLEPYRPKPRLVVVGANPIARWLLRWARDLGFATILVEQREERLSSLGTVPGGPADEVFPRGDDVTVAGEVHVVHTDHEAPDVVGDLVALIRGGASSVQFVGSRRHAAEHLSRMEAEGVEPSELERIRTPAGLDIGGRSPQEIALSILAGVVAARNDRDGGWLAP
jgi:xanthine dehydrogenase accessory factor